MLKKTINSASYFISGVLFLIGGFLFIFKSNLVIQLFIYLLCLGILIDAGLQCIFILTKKKSKKEIIHALLQSIFDVSFAMLIYIYPNFIKGSLSIIFGLYLLVYAAIDVINYCIYKYNEIKGRLTIFLSAWVKIILSCFLMFHPTAKFRYVEIIFGIYFLCYGISQINSFISEVLPSKIKRKIRIPLPILIAAFIPKRLITLINELLEVDKKSDLLDVQKEKDSGNIDIEVILHLAKSGSAAFGHIEVAFEGKIYSYGNYDMHSRKLFDAIGDGVICIADRDKYIDYAIKNKKRYLVIFGLSLTEKEKETVRERIHKLVTESTKDYYPDLQLAEMAELPSGEYHDMSSEIYKYANGTFKKIIHGRRKKFFVLSTNCAGLVETILNGVGLDLLELNGILAPGSYYDYLNSEFLKKNSKVISRKVYTGK
ncbi:MAG: DUF308 domain-containing protein [Firmicutes bacterium]|nr:DUF308 domain-containing protein [Bacillota bacterium]